MIQNWFLAVFTGLMVVACLFAAMLVDSISYRIRKRRCRFTACRRRTFGINNRLMKLPESDFSWPNRKKHQRTTV